MAEPPEQSTSFETSPTADTTAGETAQVSPAVAEQQGPAAPGPSMRALHGLWTFFVRLLVLGFGVGAGWMLGVLVAQVFPASHPNPPLQEVVMRRTSETWRKLRQLPQWWQGPDVAAADVGLETDETSLSSLSAAEETPRLSLSPELREQVETDLDQLQTDLAAVKDRLTALEAQLGEVSPNGPVEARLQELDQLLSLPGGDSEPTALPPPPRASATSSETTTVYETPAFPLISDTIVLPSSLLFEPGGSLLTPAGRQLLDTIVPDLRRYPEATLLVGSHIASNGEPQAQRKLTFQQAIAVQRYLDQQLGDIGLHWVTLGYGQTRPRIAGAGPAVEQRNQRVEIGIVPR